VDELTRLRLLVYYSRTKGEGSRAASERHVLWLIAHRPESETLGSPFAAMVSGQMSEAEYQRGKALWQEAARSHPSDARVMWNAALYFRLHDRALYERFLRNAARLDPNNENYGRDLGLLYAGAMIAVSKQTGQRDVLNMPDADFARHAGEELDRSQNAAVLEAAVHLFQSEYNSSRIAGRENQRFGEMAQRYLRRAEQLDPDMDKAWVLPQIPANMVGMLAPGAPPPEDLGPRLEAAARKIPRLEPAAFVELPAGVRTVLERRGCRVPQPLDVAKPANVIRGRFFDSAQTGWAVLCSDGTASAILVFRDDADSHPEELGKAEDRNYVQGMGGDRIGYSRMLSAVGEKFIMEHYRAYGGPKPSPIDHEGIDDAFLEKASVVHYRHGGKWLQLTGSD
jgi:tetratricopeptide (TPR) repeat protein